MYCNRGYCQWRLKNFNEAAQDLLECISRNPDNYLAYIWLYLIFSDIGKPEIAMEYWKRGKLAGGENFHELYMAIIDNNEDTNSLIDETELVKI